MSVTSKEVKVGETACNKEGGSEFAAAEGKKTTACNGKEGSPWTAGGTLPSGKSEEGDWSYFDSNAIAGEKTTAISFGIPLKTAPTAHFIPEGTPAASDPTGCKGTVAKPEADAGNLCVFAQHAIGNTTAVVFWDPQSGNIGGEAAGTAGTLVYFTAGAGTVILTGTWAVTGN